MNNTVTSESFSDHRQSISDAGGVNLDASRQKCQPVRINQLMTSYSSSSEEDEENDNNKKNKNKTSPGKNNKKIISPPSHTVSQQMTSGFTSDFAKIDIDSTTNTTTSSSSSSSLSGFLNRIPLAAATAVPLLLPSSSSQQISHSDTSSYHHPPQDKHIQGKVIYKAENPLPNNHGHQSLINKIGRVGQQQQQQLVNDGSNSVIDIETPMKHQPPAGSMRPIPSSSHRNIFQTPQGKVMPSDISYQHHSNNAQTPATILSSLHNNLMRTPLQPRTLDSQQTTTGPLNISKQQQQQQQQNPWQINEVEKRVRKPLAETTPSHHPIPTVGVIPATPSQQQQHETLPPPPAVTPAVTSPDNQKVQQSNLEFKENHHPSSKPQQQRNNKPIVQATVSSSSSNQKQPRVGDIFIIKKRRYMMLGSLGQGMSGSVYRVQDIETLELRAIKCVNLTLMEKDAAQSCIQEIKLLVKLQAPCIIRMYDYEIRDSIIYTVMEMGDTDLSKFLKEITAEKKRLPLTMILYYWSEMLTAVKHIHENGVIHSDLKPANFLLVRGRLKLIDFGISSTINADMTSVVKNSTVGTLNYISPEALKGIDDNVDGTSPSSEYKYKINFKSDVWSLGCILYSMVFGRTPFQNIRNQYGKINAIINPDIQISFKLPESTTTDSIPQILIDVLQSCLQRNPKSRPSVDQLLQVQYFKSGIESGGGGGRNGNGGTLPDIPQKTLRKIKQALQDDEWREFINNMEKMRYN